MTLQEAKERLQKIRDLGVEDPESASGEERRLYHDALASAIQGHQDIEVLKEVLKVRNIPFRRC